MRRVRDARPAASQTAQLIWTSRPWAAGPGPIGDDINKSYMSATNIYKRK